MAPLPASDPRTDWRWVARVSPVSPDPYIRVDGNDCSLDPAMVGRRVEVCVDQRHVAAVVLDTGELAARHQRCFARVGTITALEHARTLKAQREDRRGHTDGGDRRQREPEVQARSLDVYDRLTA